MAFDTGISSAVAQYVYTQSQGAVVEPIGGSYIQAYCEYLGITEPVGNSWLIALCNYFGITEPLNASWTIALANYYNITYPTGGTYWMALSQAAGVDPTPPPFIWGLNTRKFGFESRIWNYVTPVAPTADFTSDTTQPQVGEQVQFLDTSTGIPTSWNWIFTGGIPATSNEQNPLIQYDTAGNYEVSLEAINDAGTNTKVVQNYITVTVIPVVADFSADTTTPNEGDTVIFTDLSTGTPTEWSWTLPGATPDVSVEQNPSVVYSTAGTYTVALTASKVGSTDTETKVDYIEVTVPTAETWLTSGLDTLLYATSTNYVTNGINTKFN